MKEEDFQQIVQQYICPLLAGSVMTPELQHDEHQHAHELAALTGHGQTMHISETKKARCKVEIKRNQKFTGDDVKLVKAIVAQIVENFDKTASPYQERVIGYAIEVGICHFLSEHNGDLLVNILDSFDSWSARTYEGRKPTFTIVVDLNNPKKVTQSHPLITDFLDHDFFAPLSNGVDSGVLVSAQGALLEYVDFTINSADANTFAPARFISVANCADDNKLCLTLTNNGEVLIFKDQKLFFSKRNGEWNYYNDDSTLKTMPGASIEVKKAMYETILDVSFARTGGCLVAIPYANNKGLIHDDGNSDDSVVKRADILENPTSMKSRVVSRLIQGRKFQELSRAMRKELVGIDGATIIQYQGEILAVGAIVKISGGSVGGGRLAATRTLAPFGTAIKISADGMVEAFKGNADGECEAVFKL
ncbi:hypothetical protein Q5H92_11320 [Hymenobacter sp. M29]|uniref:Uncharacterized protein n=1 Tax=Hymenobacter mellowenesis TaxID=3063995 RepID=A0ABT9ACP6_9BACT|nr:hypothetical protein [Hymenobacter sp. M29]MDO7846950.1 hypothetical protein [Hymenobacter sp. M29]